MKVVVASVFASIALAMPVPPTYEDPVGPNVPWGLHIAYGADESREIAAMWSTRAAVESSRCTAGPMDSAPKMPLVFDGEQIPFSDSGNVQTLHRVLMSGLQPGTSYIYQCGDGLGNLSTVYNFTTQPEGSFTPTIAVSHTPKIQLPLGV